MYGPHMTILLMGVSRNMRHVDFRGLTGSQRTPRVRGVTVEFFSFACQIMVRSFGEYKRQFGLIT